MTSSIKLTTFGKAYNFVISQEGGLTCNPTDKGNRNGSCTNKGITQSVYDKYNKKYNRELQKVQNITDVEAQEIYFKNYYLNIKGRERQLDKTLEVVSEKLTIVLFDQAVNMGVSTAIKLLQKILGSTQDGIIGPKTINDVVYFINKRSEEELIKEVLRLRRIKYEEYSLVRGQDEFLTGWMNRVQALENYLSSL